METPAKTWAEVAKCQVNKIPPDEITWAGVIAGYSEPTLEEARRLMQKWGNRPPLINALITVHERNGGDTSNLKKFLAWRQSLPEPTKGEGFPAPPKTAEPKRSMGFDVEATFRSERPAEPRPRRPKSGWGAIKKLGNLA